MKPKRHFWYPTGNYIDRLVEYHCDLCGTVRLPGGTWLPEHTDDSISPVGGTGGQSGEASSASPSAPERCDTSLLPGHTPTGKPMGEYKVFVDTDPDPRDLVRELREALGLFAGALPYSPKQAWEEAITEVKRMRHNDGDDRG